MRKNQSIPTQLVSCENGKIADTGMLFGKMQKRVPKIEEGRHRWEPRLIIHRVLGADTCTGKNGRPRTWWTDAALQAVSSGLNARLVVWNMGGASVIYHTPYGQKERCRDGPYFLPWCG